MSETTTSKFVNEDVEIHEQIDCDSELPSEMDVLLTPDNREYVVIRRYKGAGDEIRIKLRPRDGQTPLYPSINDIWRRVNDGDWRVVV